MTDVNVQRDHDVETPLMMVAAGGTVDYVEVLLDAKADACATVSDGSTVWSLGQTILLQAVRSGKLQVIQSLLQGGIDVDAACDKGITPLMEAVRIAIHCLVTAMADRCESQDCNWPNSLADGFLEQSI